jgi:hypothetical protein
MSAEDSLKRYYKRQAAELEKAHRPKRKNNKPEFELKVQVLAWLRERGFSVDSVESKATFNRAAGRYLNSPTTVGMPDVIGTTPDGLGAFLELKSKGRRGTLRAAQRLFLTEKINRFAFSACIDSIECLAQLWEEFNHTRKMSVHLGRNLLLRHLPPESPAHGDEDLFSET